MGGNWSLLTWSPCFQYDNPAPNNCNKKRGHYVKCARVHWAYGNVTKWAVKVGQQLYIGVKTRQYPCVARENNF